MFTKFRLGNFYLLVALVAILGLLFALDCKVRSEVDSMRAEAVSPGPGIAYCGGDGMKSCLATTSQFIQKVVTPAAEVTWCINPRGLQYPNFRAQVTLVMDQYAYDLGLAGAREVPYPVSPADLSCLVRNDMRDDHPCGGCGAWIYTHNYPMLIEYNAKAGYSYWHSTIGHEDGHGFCLEDEHYDKANFRSWILTYGDWIVPGRPTVMDVGTFLLSEYAPLGIWYLTEYDLERCAETAHRAIGTVTQPPFYVAPDGWMWEFATEIWYDSRGIARFAPCNSDQLRLDLRDTQNGWRFRIPGENLGYETDYGRFVVVPSC